MGVPMELDRKALKEAESLGEKLFAATMANTDLKDRCEWADLHEWHKTSFEKTALAFAASLTHDETATAAIQAAEQRERRLREALRIAEAYAHHAIDHAIHHAPRERADLAKSDQATIRAALSEEA